MPITATLSRRFYEKFGDEVTNELVTWLNAVDQSYRDEFRELFDTHFGQLRAEMATFKVELRLELANLRSELYDRIAQGERRLLVWMIGLWLSTPLATAGIVLLLRQLHWL